MNENINLRPSFRPLLPSSQLQQSTENGLAHSPPDQPGHAGQRSQSMTKTRAPRKQIAVACTTCHQKKRKCDGARPCGPCTNQDLSCVYDIESGVTRSQALKRRNEALAEDNNQLRYIVQGLRSGSEQESSEILRRIRASKNVDEAVSLINQAALLLPGKQYSSASPETGMFFGSPSEEDDASKLASKAPTLLNLLHWSSLAMDNSLSPTSLSDPNSHSLPITQPTSISTHQGWNISRSRSSSAIPQVFDRTLTPAAKNLPLVRWSANSQTLVNRHNAPYQNVGTADRLNAILDTLPFLGDRPVQTPIVKPSPEEFYLPMISVSARPWTQITDDDELVSHLLLLFFTWEQPFYNFVEMTAFFEDMRSIGNEPSWSPMPEREYCSPALVNAILALGSKLSSRHPMCFAVPGNLLSRGRHFLNEAERLIKIDLRLKRQGITTMQAMWLCIWYRGTSGYRFRSNEFHDQFYQMYDKLRLGDSQERPQNYDTDRKARMYWNARSEIIWGFYTQEALHSIAYGAVARLRRPLIEKTFEHELGMFKEAGAHLWYPYPEIQPPQPSLRQESLSAKADLTDIIHEMLEFLDGCQKAGGVNTSDDNRVQGAMQIYGKFTHWRNSLPEVLTPNGSLAPQILLLRASYDIAVISLFRSLQDVSPEYGNTGDHPRSKVVSHCQALMATMTTFRNHWSLFRHCYVMQAHWLPAFALLFHLRLGEPVADVFTLTIRGLREVGQKWPVAAWMLQIVKGMAKEYGVILPKSCLKWLELELPPTEDTQEKSDAMLPVTIPMRYQIEHPMHLGRQVGTYMDDLDTVLMQLERIRVKD